MSKELQALYDLIETINSYNEISNNAYIDIEKLDDKISLIEGALKGLERVKELCLEHDIHDTAELDNTLTAFEILKKDCDFNYKRLDVLEIIIEKEVNVQDFKLCLEQGWTYETCERYCQDNDKWEEHPPYKHSMTREEFNSLKEVCR